VIILQKTYDNGFVRTIAVESVTATDDADTVLLQTQDDGVMALCRPDQPDLWAQLALAGGLPA
jgi:hypothetical protein